MCQAQFQLLEYQEEQNLITDPEALQAPWDLLELVGQSFFDMAETRKTQAIPSQQDCCRVKRIYELESDGLALLLTNCDLQ